MLLGAHVSPAGGPARAVDRGVERGAEAIQFFNQSPRAWRAREYTDEEAAEFRDSLKASSVETALIHTVYLINCASRDRTIRGKSLKALTIALRSGAALGVNGVVLHAGSALAGDVKRAIARAGKVIRAALDDSEDCPLHLEDTAGAGGTLGRSFAELAALIEAAGGDDRLGLCLDSCHLYASGYDVRTVEGLGQVIDECAEVIGGEPLGARDVHHSPAGARANSGRRAPPRGGVPGGIGRPPFAALAPVAVLPRTFTRAG